jgi:hypothetical protein
LTVLDCGKELDTEPARLYQLGVTTRARFLDVMNGRPVDRVPLLLDGFLYNEVGYLLDRSRGYDWHQQPHWESAPGFIFNNHGEIEQEPDPLKREISHRAVEICPIVLSWPSYENRYFMTPPSYFEESERAVEPGLVQSTVRINTPEGALTAVTARNAYTVWTERYPVQSLEDVDRIRSIPWERPAALEAPRPEVLPPDFDRRYLLTTRVSSPFVCVAGMMPYQMFLELCATHMELLVELSRECHRRILDTLEVLLSTGRIDVLWMGGCEWITPPMASPDQYRTLVQEFEGDIIERAHESGALCHIHCHGNVRDTLELIVERGGDFTEPVEPPPDGDITFAEAKNLAGGRITLGGNIEAGLLKNGTAGEVELAVRNAFEGGTERMVLMPTAYPIDRFTRQMAENYHRLIDVWETESLKEGRG